MKRIIFTLLISLFLIGCATTEKTKYVDKYIPIPICPMPPKLEEPVYYASTLTEEQKNDIGELSKAYVISSNEAKNYIENLQRVYDQYVELAKRSIARLKALESIGAEVDTSIVEQTTKEVDSQLQALSLEIDKANKEHSENMQQSLSKVNE